jgi:hypothetical protein
LKLLGGIPSDCRPAFSDIADAYSKPITLLKHRDDRNFLLRSRRSTADEQHARLSGRATLQVYQKLLMRNELATADSGPNKLIDLADARASHERGR